MTWEEDEERDVPQLMAQLRVSGVLIVDPDVDQDIPQIISELEYVLDPVDGKPALRRRHREDVRPAHPRS